MLYYTNYLQQNNVIVAIPLMISKLVHTSLIIPHNANDLQQTNAIVIIFN